MLPDLLGWALPTPQRSLGSLHGVAVSPLQARTQRSSSRRVAVVNAKASPGGEDGDGKGRGGLQWLRRGLTEVRVALQRPVTLEVPFWAPMVASAAAVSVLFVGVVAADESALLAAVREKVTLFDYILEDISASYVEEVDLSKLFESGVNAMLSSLDPYTQFENVNQTRDLAMLTTGKYGGVGLVISPDVHDKSRIAVNDAFEDYAFKAGLRSGDFIVDVDGQPVKDLTVEQVTEKLRGPAGSKVTLTVLREGQKGKFRVTIERHEIQVRNVPAFGFIGEPDSGIAYIRLQSFGTEAGMEVRTALESMARQRPIKGFVFDLRGNPGGLLNSAVDVSELFVPRGSVVVTAKGRSMDYEPSYRSSRDPELQPSTPVAVLVNGSTASAAEIVSGAIQDYDLGVIVGTRTFGKGLIQNIETLPYNTSLKYTVGRYYTPSGRCIQDKTFKKGEAVLVADSERKAFKTRAGRTVLDGGGVAPDVEVEALKVTELENALVEQGMFFYFANDFAAKHPQIATSDLTITDETYDQFTSFVEKRGDFKFRTRFDDGISALKTALLKAGFDTASSEILDVQNAIQEELRTEFSKHRESIGSRLLDAILARYEPDSVRMMTTLKGDHQVEKALEVLQQPKVYKKLLST